MMFGTEDFVRKVVGEEWKERMQDCKTEKEWIMEAERCLDVYYERKLPRNPKYEKKNKV